MRTLTNSALTIEYPDNQVFSGDLNRIAITKNTTATHVEISYTINGYNYNENLYFLTNTIEFSMSDILKLIYLRSVNVEFNTILPFYFSIKLYNNTSLIDTENLFINAVILGKRRVFDKLGIIKNPTLIDYFPEIGINKISYYFKYLSDLYVSSNDYEELLGQFIGYNTIDIDLISTIYFNRLYYKIKNFILNPTFLDAGGNYWSDGSIDAYRQFKFSTGNKLLYFISASHPAEQMEVSYLGGAEFIEGRPYDITLSIETIVNPSDSDYNIYINLGGNISTYTGGVQSFVAGADGTLKIIIDFLAGTPTLAHTIKISSILIIDDITHSIYTNQECIGNGENLGLKFLNRFGIWKSYAVVKKTENIASSNGISLLFSENNLTEFNNTFSEQKKNYTQSITIYRDNVSKEIVNDFSDIIHTDHVHLYDDVNSVWIPVKVTTGSFNILEKENLFDISLNILLQSNNE